MLITTLVVSFLVCCRLEVGVVSGLQAKARVSLQPGHHSKLTAPNLQPTEKQEQKTNVVNSIVVVSS